MTTPIAAENGGLQDGLRAQLLEQLPVRERPLELDGIATPIVEGGDGPPIVLLHGPGANATHWMRVLPGLVDGHRVIAPDLPGHGASRVTGGTLDVPRVLRWLEHLVDETCDTPPALVGYVLGGAVAMRFAAEHGKKLARLVLVDSLGLVGFAPAPKFGAALQGYLADPTDATHDGLWEQCAHDLGGLRASLGNRWAPFKAYNLDRVRDPAVMASLGTMFELFGHPAIEPETLERIDVPTALVWGRHDLATPVAAAQAASTRYGWPLTIIEDCADDPPMEQPDAFVEALRAVLSDDRNAMSVTPGEMELA